MFTIKFYLCEYSEDNYTYGAIFEVKLKRIGQNFDLNSIVKFN